MTAPSADPRDDADPPPPVFGRWSRLYAVVLVVLVITIVAMGWLTVRFR